MLTLDPHAFADEFEAGKFLREYGGGKMVEILPGAVNIGTPNMVDSMYPTREGKTWLMPPDTRLYSALLYGATLRSNAVDCADGAQWNLNHKVMIDGFIIENTYPKNEQSVVIGFAGDKPVINHCDALVSNCILRGTTHTLYHWHGNGNRLRGKNLEIYGARWVAGLGLSGSGPCGFVNLESCNLYGDYETSTYDPAGEVDCRCIGFWQRGGVCTLDNVYIHMKGSPGFENPNNPDLLHYPKCALVCALFMPTTDPTQGGREGGNKDAMMTAINVHCRVDPNGSTEWADFKTGSGDILRTNCTGSEDDLTLKEVSTDPGLIVP